MFAGEAFHEAPKPPDVSAEHHSLMIRLVSTLVALLVIAPALLGKWQNTTTENTAALKWLPRFNILGFLLVAAWILQTPNNFYSARSVFVAPLFSQEECSYIINASHEAAQRNLQQYPNNTGFQQSPKGWRKQRHGSFPTIDLNVVTDPFTKENRQYLASILHKRLSPLLSRIYGIPPGAIRAQDMFVVRYDAQNQQALKAHTDEAFVSFNILLNDDFEGGGTRFYNRHSNTSEDVHPPLGHVLMSNAVIRHEGLPTTRGTRYILVGFLGVDKTHIFTGTDTGLSLFASWLSMPWAQVRFSQASSAAASRQRQGLPKKWTDNAVIQTWCRGMAAMLEYLGDVLAPHEVYSLVHVDNATNYQTALDNAESSSGKAIWFQGQRLVIDVDGSIVERIGTNDAGTSPRT